MSDNLIERLRADADRWMSGDFGRDNEEAGMLSHDAADEITRLRAELSSLRGEGEGAEHYTVAMERRPKEIGGVSVSPGLYRIHWKSGGSSLAAIGMCANGAWWVAPTNWVAPAVAFGIDEDPEGRWSWACVESLERLDPAHPTPDSDVIGRLVGALQNAQYALEFWQRESGVWLDTRVAEAKPGWMARTRRRGAQEITRARQALASIPSTEGSTS